MLGLRIEPELARRLEAIALRTGRTKSDIAREALAKYLADQDLPAEARGQSLAATAAQADEDFWPVDGRGWTA